MIRPRTLAVVAVTLVATTACGRLADDERSSERPPPSCVRAKLATNEADAVSVVADARDTYWIAQQARPGSFVVRHQPTDGQSPPDDFAVGEGAASTIVMDQDTVFVLRHVGELIAYPRQGGSPRTLHSSLGAKPEALAIDDTYVYVGAYEYEPALLRIDKSNGAVTTLVTSTARIFSIASNGRDVFWNDGLEKLRRVSRKGGEPVDVADVTQASLAANERFLAWTGWNEGTVHIVSLANGEHAVAASGQNHPAAVELTENDVVWVEFGTLPAGKEGKDDGSVRRASLTSRTETHDILASRLRNPTSLAIVDDTVLYSTRGRFVPGADFKNPDPELDSNIGCTSLQAR